MLGGISKERINCLLTTQSTPPAIKEFWGLPLEEQALSSPEHKRIEEHFTKHLKIDKDGRFVVKIPFTEQKKEIAQNYDITFCRFMEMEREIVV